MKDKTVDTGRDIAEYNGKEEKREGKKEEFERIESLLFARNGKFGEEILEEYSRGIRRNGEARRGEGRRAAEGVYWLASNSGLGYGQLTSVTGWQVEIVLGVKSISRVDDRDLVAFLTFSFYRHRGKARVLTRN